MKKTIEGWPPSWPPRPTICKITERARERDEYLVIISRALDELLELHVRGGGNVLGDFLDDNSELMLADVCEQIPTLLDAYNRDLIFRAIEILNEINER